MYFQVSVCRSNRVFEAENRVFQGIHKPKVGGSSPPAAISERTYFEARALAALISRRFESPPKSRFSPLWMCDHCSPGAEEVPQDRRPGIDRPTVCCT